MGSVWLAQHLRLDIPCAVKFIHGAVAMLPAARSRFDREAKAAAQIQSSHVVQIFDCGLWEGAPYIAMEFLKGEDLAARLRAVRKISPAETFVILSDVCRALTKAHEVGLVHRDLKPSNIFLVAGDDREIAKVLDFGIAKDMTVSADESTRTGALLGTPFYMSPEQVRGSREVDQRSDLWAVGVLAYQCLTGRLPFHATGIGDLLLQILMDPVDAPSAVAPVPVGFDAFWTRASARDPNQRFQTTRELMAALEVALRTESLPSPVVAADLGSPAESPATDATLPAPTPLPQSVTLKPKSKPHRATLWSVLVGVAILLGAVGAFVGHRFRAASNEGVLGLGAASIAPTSNPATPAAHTAEEPTRPPPLDASAVASTATSSVAPPVVLDVDSPSRRPTAPPKAVLLRSPARPRKHHGIF